jgi:hypothetical protein
MVEPASADGTAVVCAGLDACRACRSPGATLSSDSAATKVVRRDRKVHILRRYARVGRDVWCSRHLRRSHNYDSQGGHDCQRGIAPKGTPKLRHRVALPGSGYRLGFGEGIFDAGVGSALVFAVPGFGGHSCSRPREGFIVFCL